MSEPERPARSAVGHNLEVSYGRAFSLGCHLPIIPSYNFPCLTPRN